MGRSPHDLQENNDQSSLDSIGHFAGRITRLEKLHFVVTCPGLKRENFILSFIFPRWDNIKAYIELRRLISSQSGEFNWQKSRVSLHESKRCAKRHDRNTIILMNTVYVSHVFFAKIHPLTVLFHKLRRILTCDRVLNVMYFWWLSFDPKSVINYNKQHCILHT